MSPRSSSSDGLYPDPRVTANLYCSGELDRALLQAVLPFRRDLRQIEDGAPYLWIIRYARGGEHLKWRVHGAAESEGAVRERLRARADEFLEKLGPLPEGAERAVRPDAIPIDQEDASEAPPDRTLLFTHYGRSHVSLGGEPLLSDETYRARMTTCLARACDLVLDALEREEQDLSYGQRQRLLLKAILAGLAALRLDLPEAVSYLAYHRDWLIRFPLLKRENAEQEAALALDRLTRQAEKSASSLEALQSTAREWWTGQEIDPAVYPEGATWIHAMADLLDFLQPFRTDPACRQDPFTPDGLFPPVFKALHGLANQLGLKQRDESFAYHLLLQAAAEDPSAYQTLLLTPP